MNAARTYITKEIPGPGRVGCSHALLLGVLVLAAALRMFGVGRVGIRFDDESWYASDARLWHRCARVLADPVTFPALVLGDTGAIRRRMAEIGVDFNHRYGKPCPGFTFPAAAMMFIVGDHPAALHWTNAICGTFSVWLLYQFALVLYGRRTAWVAALLLALSPYHLYYCRSALTDATAGMFVMLGSLFWAWGRSGQWPTRRAYLLSGVAWGAAITCHNRCAVVPILLVLWELVSVRRIAGPEAGGSMPQTLQGNNGVLARLSFLAIGVLLPCLTFECLFQTARFVANAVDGYYPVPTFFEALWDYSVLLGGRLGMDSGAAWNPAVLTAYVVYYVRWHGLMALFFMAVGLAITLLKPGPGRWAAILVLGTMGLLTFQRYTVARAVSTVLPFMSLCVAMGLLGLCRFVGSQRWMRSCLIAAMVLVTVPAAGHVWALVHQRSSIEEACAFLIRQGRGTVGIPMDSRKYTLFLEHTPIETVSVLRHRFSDSPAETLDLLREMGVRWLVTDAQHWHCRRLVPPDHGVFDWWEGMRSELASDAKLVAEFPHLLRSEWEFLAEGWGLTYWDAMVERRGGALRIYELRSSHDPDEGNSTEPERSASNRPWKPGMTIGSKKGCLSEEANRP